MNNLLTQRDVEHIQEILSRQLGVNPEQLVDTATIMGDLGADSLDVVEISMLVEERLNVSVTDEQWEEARTVGALYELVGRIKYHGCQRPRDPRGQGRPLSAAGRPAIGGSWRPGVYTRLDSSLPSR